MDIIIFTHSDPDTISLFSACTKSHTMQRLLPPTHWTCQHCHLRMIPYDLRQCPNCDQRRGWQFVLRVEIESVPLVKETEDTVTCGICWETLDDGHPVAKLSCDHVFCVACVNHQIRVNDERCGQCRTYFVHYKYTPGHIME